MPVSLNNVSQINNTQLIKQQPKTTDENAKSFPTKTAVVAGAGLAALAAVGIYIATRGRGGVKSVNKQNTETTNQIKEMTVELFKKEGNKFLKGRAIMADGSNYSGKMTSVLQDGKKIVCEYENGFLKNSTKSDCEKVLFNKEYKYNNKGNLIEVTENSDKPKKLFSAEYDNKGKTVIGQKVSYRIDPSGKLKILNIEGNGSKEFRYTSDGKLHSYTHHYFENGTFMHDLVILHPDGKTKRIVIGGDGKSTFYDKEGNIVDSIYLDLMRGGKDICYHNNHIFNKDFDKNGRTRDYKFKGLHSKARGWISKYNFIEDGKVVPQKNLYLTLDDGRKYSLIKDGSKEISIIPNGSENFLPKDSAEYKEVFNRAKDWVQEFKSEYKKAMKLQNEVLISKRQSEKIANSAL